MLFREHGLDPTAPIGSDDPHCIIELPAVKTLSPVDLADLLALAFGVDVDVLLFGTSSSLADVLLGASPKVVCSGHRATVRHQVRAGDHNVRNVRLTVLELRPLWSSNQMEGLMPKGAYRGIRVAGEVRQEEPRRIQERGLLESELQRSTHERICMDQR